MRDVKGKKPDAKIPYYLISFIQHSIQKDYKVRKQTGGFRLKVGKDLIKKNMRILGVMKRSINRLLQLNGYAFVKWLCIWETMHLRELL